MAPNPDISRVRGVHFVYDQGLYHLGFEVGHYISLERACPVVSRDMIRRVLVNLKRTAESNAWDVVQVRCGEKRGNNP